MKFYSLRNILSKHAQYNLIIGERSNGKTYALLTKALEDYFKKGYRSVYLRRFDDSLTPKYIADMFDSIISNGVISKLSKCKYNTVIYRSRRWYLALRDIDNTEILEIQELPFMYCFALNKMETIKSGFSDTSVKTIIFDEFLTRQYYLSNEFIIFQNMISTIVRNRNDVTIYMLANTVNKSCPYFDEMGLTNVKQQTQGTIDVYSYGNSQLKVAVEYCSSCATQKKSNVYFAFNNPRLQMITKGGWEIDNYPHPDFRVSTTELISDDIYLLFDGEILQMELRCDDYVGEFVLIHPYTHNEIKMTDTTRVYSLQQTSDKRYCLGTLELMKIDQIIWDLFYNGCWYYSSNSVGEIVNNYVKQFKRA